MSVEEEVGVGREMYDYSMALVSEAGYQWLPRHGPSPGVRASLV